MAQPQDKVKDPFEYLIEDHKKVADIFEDLENTSESDVNTREKMFEKLYNELGLHAELEEATLYPTLEKIDETKEMVEHSKEEHETMKTILTELEAMPKDNPEWGEKLSELKTNVEEHVEDEEESEGLFEKAQEVLGAEDIENLRDDMEDFLREQ
jgi:hypothetical protein